MNEGILKQYIDACELIRETEREIRKLRGRKAAMASDSVKGSMGEFPYTAKNFHIEGIAQGKNGEQNMLEAEERLLARQEQEARALKLQVEEWLSGVPARNQRIIRYRYFEGLSWEQVAARMGRGSSADSIRMEMRRFLKK